MCMCYLLFPQCFFVYYINGEKMEFYSIRLAFHKEVDSVNVCHTFDIEVLSVNVCRRPTYIWCRSCKC